jgi:nitrogen PTS system EIIA component
MNEQASHIHLGPAVRTLRLAAGLSLREMARRIDVSPAYLSGVELEKVSTPTHDRLRAIASVLGVPPRHLTALSERLSPDLIEFLEATPEAVRFLRVARSIGLEADEFAALASRLTEKSTRHPGSAAPSMSALGRLLDPARTWCLLPSRTKEGLLENLTRRVLRDMDEVYIELAVDAVIAREKEVSTGIGGGIALAHAEVAAPTECALGVCTLACPLDFDAIDGLPVRLVFLVLGAAGGADDRLRVLARIAQICVRPGLPTALENTTSDLDLYECLRQADAQED